MATTPVPITFEKGLNESLEASMVPDGGLTECLNWIPQPTGGLRARGKYLKGSVTGLPVTRRCRGIGVFRRVTDPLVVQATTVYRSASTGATPTITWSSPTNAGNTLVAFVSMASIYNGTISFTATGWTERVALGTAIDPYVTPLGIYELVTTESYSGNTTPFSFTNGSASSTIIQVYELAGVGDFDVLAQASDSDPGVSVTTPLSTTATTATTTQASALCLAFDSSFRWNAGIFQTLSTSSDGWTEYVENGSNTNVPYYGGHHRAAVYQKTVRTVGTQSITVDMTTDTFTGDQNIQNLALLVYKGWSNDPTPVTQADLLFAANDNGSTYDIWSIGRDELASGTWTSLDPGLGDTSEDAALSFVVGLNASWYTAPSFTGLRRFDGAASTVADSPANAKSVTFHRDRIWASSGTRLSFSQIADGQIWPNSPDNTGAGYMDIGREDGEDIECVAAFQGFLVVGKLSSIHLITGRNAEEFDQEKLEGGGAAPGRSVLPTPFGCLIAGRDMVYTLGANVSALTASTNVASISDIGRNIQQSYSVDDGEYVMCDYIDGSAYITIVGVTNRTFVYEFTTEAWRMEQIGAGTVEQPGAMFSYAGTQYVGPVTGIEGSLVNYRSFPNPTRGKDFDALEMVFAARTGDLPMGQARLPITPENLYLQLRQRGGDASETALNVTPYFDGVAGIECRVAPGDVGVRRHVVSGFRQKGSVNTVGIRFAQTLSSGEAAVFDIENASMDVIAEPASIPSR